MSHPYELSRPECEKLLRAGVFGRLGVATPAGPHVIPVNYAVVDDSVVVRTSPDSVAGRHAPGAVVAFEIDLADYEYRRGWSVQARGPADRLSAAEEDELAPLWVPRPWTDGSRPLFLRIRWQELTGRRLGAGWDPWRTLPVRRAV